MTTGLAATTLANKWLDMLGGSAFTAPAGTYIQLHTADPGAAGTTSPCTGTVGGDRKALTWAAASAGSKAITTTLPSWATWDGGSVTISHVSVWDAAGSGAGAGTADTGGNFLFSGALTAPKAITNGDTYNQSSLSVAFTPVAA